MPRTAHNLVLTKSQAACLVALRNGKVSKPEIAIRDKLDLNKTSAALGALFQFGLAEQNQEKCWHPKGMSLQDHSGSAAAKIAITHPQARSATALELEGPGCQTGSVMSPIRQNAASDSFNEIATVRIELRHADPLIWRQVEVPTSITLKVLHDIIQAVMGWFDYHLWQFTIGKQRYGLPMDDDWGTEPRIDASKVRLRDVLKPRKTVIDYIYDFGDCWEHRLTVTNVRAGEPGMSYPRYIGGERNGPLEDCGGIPGFCELLEALADPNHPNHADAKEWSDDYDPDTFDELPIKYALARIANRRNAARSRLAKKKPLGSAA